jgi:hypothetical protein
MVKFIMFFHEVLESYLSAVQQITPIFAYMVSIVCFVSVYAKVLRPDSFICTLWLVSCRGRRSLKRIRRLKLPVSLVSLFFSFSFLCFFFCNKGSRLIYNVFMNKFQTSYHMSQTSILIFSVSLMWPVPWDFVNKILYTFLSSLIHKFTYW